MYALAKAAGLSDETLYAYRRKGTDPVRGNLIKIAEAAGVTVEWLATGKGPRPRTSLDIGMLKWAIEAVEGIIAEDGTEGMEAETRADMIARAYEGFVKGKRKLGQREVREILKQDVAA